MGAVYAGFDSVWKKSESDRERVSRSGRIIWLTAILVGFVIAWSYFATLDEVSVGGGRVVPTMREQVVQSLEGGILAELMVRQDDIVEAGQVLARLDPTKTESSVDESSAKYRAALASAARLRAEVGGTDVEFPKELDDAPDLRDAEMKLYSARKRALEDTLLWVGESVKLVRSELQINENLAKMGAASKVEVIRLQRQLADLELKQAETRATYIVTAREELAKANAEIESLASVIRGRSDSLNRLTLRSPVRGIVKNIEVSSINGVVPPNGKLMDIVPLDDQLLVEARISPRDIAFIHPDQRASVKISAYDYAIYGALEGKVASISPDTIQDETDPNIFYYRVFIRTEADALVNEAGKQFPITPGMVATVDIHTGQKTVFEYLLKPFNRAREALRER
jgi:adhesin transport system membrane fusion protein